MAVIGGITVIELARDFAEGISQGGPTAHKAYKVPNWADRYAVANGVLFQVALTGGPTGTIAFSHAMAYPDSPNIQASQVSIRGLGAVQQGPRQIAWDSAVVSVEFGRTPYQNQQSADPGGYNSFDPSQPLIYASQTIDVGGSVIELKPGSVKYKVSSGVYKTLDAGFAKFVGVNTFSLTLHQMPYMLPASKRSLVGSINDAPFFGCDTGTLMFNGATITPSYQADGSMTQETNLKFSHRPEASWDKIYDPTGATDNWYPVVISGGANTSVLTSIDFTGFIPTEYYGSG